MASASEILKAYLHCARTPAEDAVERIRTQLKKQYGAAEVELTVSVEPDLISGYVLQVGDRVFDNSGKSALAAITADAPSLAVMQTRVEDYKPAATTAEGGTVISAADGVVDVKGMDQAVYGEIVTFDNGAKGMVESVEPDHLGIMLFDKIEEVGVGTLVTRSGKRAGIPVGDGFLGRVISPLGEPSVNAKRVPICTPSAPNAIAASMLSPDPIPPAAINGTVVICLTAGIRHRVVVSSSLKVLSSLILTRLVGQMRLYSLLWLRK